MNQILLGTEDANDKASTFSLLLHRTTGFNVFFALFYFLNRATKVFILFEVTFSWGWGRRLPTSSLNACNVMPVNYIRYEAKKKVLRQE